MLKISDILGLPIYCENTLKKEGRVKDFLVNIKEKRIEWIMLNCGNFFYKTRFINYNSIYTIGKNAIIIKSKSNILKNIKISRNYHDSREVFFGKEVISHKGNIIGFIDDIVFQKSEGKILGLILTNGIIDDILHGVDILPYDDSFVFTNDKLIIPEGYKRNIIKNAGGLKKLLELEK